MNEEIRKAVEGLKHQDNILMESDSELREEIILHKLDYLTDVVAAVVRLLIEMRAKLPFKDSVVNYNNWVVKAHAEANKRILQSVEEYKERKK